MLVLNASRARIRVRRQIGRAHRAALREALRRNEHVDGEQREGGERADDADPAQPLRVRVAHLHHRYTNANSASHSAQTNTQ